MRAENVHTKNKEMDLTFVAEFFIPSSFNVVR
jgi:hypothetical protein